jgi:pilus assembly protein CpaC
MRTMRLFILVIACLGSSSLVRAQAPMLKAASMTVGAPETETNSVRLMVGRSTVVDTPSPIVRVSLTSPDIADALVTSPSQLLINGKIPGTISMFVWDRSGGIKRYEVVVQRDLARLNEQIRELFPGESIDAQSNGRNIVLSGKVSSKEAADRAVNLAAGYVDKKDEVTTLMQVRETGASNQVLLRVRFAEVSRSAMTELGASLFTGANGYKNIMARSTTEQQAAPVFDNADPSNEKLVFSDFLNLFLFDAKHQLGTVIKALQTKGMFQSLAEPNLVAESGKEASFLAGGEIPIPVAQGSGNNLAISVQYKEFGVRLNFTPVVTGNRVHLKVRPEVSTLDFSNAVVLNGFRIPALSTRRTETEPELESGQTFAIAGLMNNNVNSTLQKIPGIGDIPILGQLFRSKQAQKNLTELVVMITPEILPKSSSGVTTVLPRTPESYLPPLPLKKSFETPPPAFTPAREEGADHAAAPAAAPAAAAPTTPAAPDAQKAAAAVSALNPLTRSVVHADAAPQPSAPQPVAPQTAAPQATAPPAAEAAQPDAASHPLSASEKKALERAHKQEESAKAQAAKDSMKQLEIDRRRQKQEDEQQAKAAREQAKRDQEEAKREAAAAKVAAKQATEQAKRQAEIDKKQQKAMAEAEAKLKAAQKEYQSEMAKAKQ